jgi:glyoxylase-like metal-dependent hydrolase (beta-lactamase superfamily II)
MQAEGAAMGVDDQNGGAEVKGARPERSPASRRAFLAGTGAAAGAAAVAALGAGPLAQRARATEADGTLPSYAPIPESALGPPLNANQYFVGRIAGDLYWVTDSLYQSMFLTTEEGVVIVDAPPTIGGNLRRAIDEVTQVNGRPSKVTHQVYSHSHSDHIGASVLFGPDVIRIGHRECRTLLLRDDDPNRPVPTVTFDDRYTLSVGGQRLELIYHGPNHSPDNIFVWAPEQRALMLVDVIFPGWVPWQNLAVSQDIPDWIKAQDIALSYPWQTLVAGHLGRLGTRADAELQIAYVADLLAAARATVTGLNPQPFYDQYGNNSWAIFKAYLDAASAQTAGPVTAKYLGKLAAADVFTISNAFSVLELAVREDEGLLGPFGIQHTS